MKGCDLLDGLNMPSVLKEDVEYLSHMNCRMSRFCGACPKQGTQSLNGDILVFNCVADLAAAAQVRHVPALQPAAHAFHERPLKNAQPR